MKFHSLNAMPEKFFKFPEEIKQQIWVCEERRELEEINTSKSQHVSLESSKREMTQTIHGITNKGNRWFLIINHREQITLEWHI